jgi:hypothetical protein
VKAVLKLVLTYFTGTRLLAAISTLGFAAVLGGGALYLYLPPLRGGQGEPSPFSLGIEAAIFLAPVIGVVAVAFGAALLPTLFTRLAASHYLYVLPHGRSKLLASAFLTLALVALVAAGTTTMYYTRTPLDLGVVFQRAFVVSLLTCTLLYVVLWLTGRTSSALGLLIGAIVMIATLVVPIRFIALPSRSLAAPWIATLVIFGAFATAFLLAPRRKGAAPRLSQALATRLTGASYQGGREVDFLIGTARPWALAIGQIVPILLAAYFLTSFEVRAPSAATVSPWLFFMTILSLLAGAIASFAATRSRRLWLRSHWTRAQLFTRVEKALWGHNSFPLGVLLVLFVVLGSFAYSPTDLALFGMGLLILAIALSTYLGLMITGPIGWLDAVLAIAAMLLLLGAAAYISRPATPQSTVIAFEAALAVLAFIFRSIAQRRWTKLDWLRCRAESEVRAAG